MADVPANAHPCQSCPRPIWGKADRCGSCSRLQTPAEPRVLPQVPLSHKRGYAIDTSPSVGGPPSAPDPQETMP